MSEQEDDIGSAFSGFSTDGGDTAPSPDIDDTNGVFSEHMFSVKAILGQLARISTAIRRSGAKYRYRKADSSLKVEDYKDFEDHLTLVVLKGNLVANAAEQGGAIAMLSRLTDSQLLTKVQKRLIDANIVRRNRIIFATRLMRAVVEKPVVEHPQNHKLPMTITEMPSETTEPEPEHELAPQLSKKPPDSAFNRPTVQLQEPSIKAFSVTQTATEIGSQLNTQRAMEFKNSKSSIITRITKIGGAQDYPGCPEPTSDFLQCPYCADLLPAAYSENQSRWRGHVAQDICPYMCIYEDCETSDQMYLTSDDLLNHMRNQHGTTHWVCSHCGSRSETGHSYVFKSLEDWESHMETEHTEVHPSRLQSLSKVSQRILLEPLGCPLCGYVTEHPQSTLDDHIAKHVHEFALRCLPWGTGRGAMESANMQNVDDSTSSELLTEGDEDDQGGDVAYFDPTEADSPAKLFERLEDIHSHFSRIFEPRAIYTELYEEELRGKLLSVIEQFSEYISAAGPFVTLQADQLVQQESHPLALIDFFDTEDIQSQQERVRMSGKLLNYTSNLSPSFPGRDSRLLEIYGSHVMKITQILYQALLGWDAQQPSTSFDPQSQITKIILEMMDEHESGATKAELAKECDLKSDQQGDVFKKKSDVEKKSMEEYKTQITRRTKMMIEDELDVLSAALSRVPFEDQQCLSNEAKTDIDEAICTARQAFEATPQDHPDRATKLNNYCLRLMDRYSRTGELADLEEAIHKSREVITFTTTYFLNQGKLPIEADHSDIDTSNSDYIIIQSRIEKWVQKAPAVIRELFRRLRTKFSLMEAEYIASLKAPDYTAFRNLKIDNPTTGTLGWFLELQQFSSWSKAQESSVLWVNGSPGQGKTIVAKFLLAYLEDLQHSLNHRTTVIYFFFYDQDDSYRTVSAAVRSLIKQLLSTQGAFDVISDQLNIKASTISDESAWDILEELLRSPVFGTIYCVIDALDECHDDESSKNYWILSKT